MNRLPAAYEDAMDALHWIKTTNEDFFTSHVDYSRCFLMGERGWKYCLQRGSTCGYRGLILVQPFFGGTKRTPSEVS